MSSRTSTTGMVGDDPVVAHGVPGKRAGTERWFVHFTGEPIDLSAYRREMYGERNPERVAALVAGYERAMQAAQRAFVDRVRALDGTVTDQYWLIHACVIEITPAMLPAVRALDGVARLEPDRLYAPLIKSSINARNHNSAALHSNNVLGRGTTVAIVDTGQDVKVNGANRHHMVYRDLQTNTSRLVLNRKIGAQPADDVQGHGTAVASIAVGAGWNTAGASVGHAYGAQICGYAIADSTTGSTTSSTKVRAYQQIAVDAASYGIRVTNTSYQGSNDPTSAEQAALDSLAVNADILNCTAAGNDGTSTSSSMINCNGISVGAVETNTHKLASFSSRGWTDGQIFPDICANGVGIVMAQRDDESSNNVGSGTSMASPQVAGIAALIRASRPNLLTNEVRALLLATSEITPETSVRQVHGPGAGYANAPLAWIRSGNIGQVGHARLGNGQIFEADVALTANTLFQCAITWMRSNFQSSQWSNLDLELWFGSTLLASSRQGRNTEEFLRVPVPVTGNYVLRVTAPSIVGAAQDFAWSTTSSIVPRKSNLTIDTMTSSAIDAGGIADIRATFRNSGTGVAAPTRGFFTISNTSAAKKTDTMLWHFDVPALAPSQTVTIRGNVPIPGYLPTSSAGSIGAFADVDDQLDEANESDNTRTISVVTTELANGARRTDYRGLYTGDFGARTCANATLSASRPGNVDPWHTSKNAADHYALILLSTSQQFQQDVATDFGISLLNSPVFQHFFSVKTGLLTVSAIRWPGGVTLGSDVTVYLHTFWFDASFANMVHVPRVPKLTFTP
ncbi:MAG: S8 family serine peptidase [Planctomycetes bacterium]|nr:S8 family serine peptidase [Planctomycetota bacterium]